jgi:hypothetical protein
MITCVGLRVGTFWGAAPGALEGLHAPPGERGAYRAGVEIPVVRIHVLAAGPIHTIPFRYEFGAFSAQAQQRMMDEAYALSRRFLRLENPLFALSQRAQEIVRELVEEEQPERLLERLQDVFTLEELGALQRYVQRRLIMRLHPRFWRRRWPALSHRLRRPLRELKTFWKRFSS